MTDFSFIEYSYNPRITPTQKVYGGLAQVGFVHRSQHVRGLAGFWNQNRCIVLLRETEEDVPPHISGLGFIADETVIEELGGEYDNEIEVYVAVAPNGLRILMVPEHHARVTMDEQYAIIDRTRNYLGPLDCITGAVVGATSENSAVELSDYMSSLGFKVNKHHGQFITLVSTNRRFSLVIDTGADTPQVKALICDTPDVFDATAMFSLSQVKLKQFDVNASDLNFGKLNASIVGYNLLADGDPDKYTIENMAEGISPGLDLIFRQRKQFLHISDYTLHTYYANSHRVE